MSQKQIFIWEIVGFVFISLLGSLFHLAFRFFGEWPPVALVAAVNESVWEHLKLAFWPALFYGLIERPFFRGSVKNFWAGKTIGILVMPIVIASVFYGYTALAGPNVLWADISLFFAAVWVGQMTSYRLLISRPLGYRISFSARVLLILMFAAFSLLTFFPLHWPLFCDPRTGRYGF